MARTTSGRTRYGLRERIYRIMFEMSMEISLALSRHQKRVCPECDTTESDPDARFCRRCSAGLV